MGQNLIRFCLQHIAVLYRQVWYDPGAPGAPVASPAGHHALSSEGAPVEICHHQDHHAGPLLEGGVVGIFCPVATALFAVAFSAVHTGRSGEESHRLQELVYRDSFEELDIFEGLFRQERFLFQTCLVG